LRFLCLRAFSQISLWQGSFYPPLRMADLVWGQKADLPASNLSLVVRPSSVFRPPSSIALRPSLFVPTPKVKKCKKSVQNMLKTCLFLLIFVQNARVFVNFLSIFAHFYPHF
jgi:hypothetical protein